MMRFLHLVKVLCRLLVTASLLLVLFLTYHLFSDSSMPRLTESSTTKSSLDTGNNESTVSSPWGPVAVVIVAYQRTGSSFLGEMFNQNPKAFQWFEPLDGLYSAIYGTEYGFNVPADIRNFWNGSERPLPDYELEAIAQVTANILKCQLDRLPTEVLLHEFIEMFSAEQKRMLPYTKCVTGKHPLKRGHLKNLASCRMCNVRLSKVCGKRFGQNMNNQLQCAQLLLPGVFPGIKWQYLLNNGLPMTKNPNIVNTVLRYQSCMSACRKLVLTCLPLLKQVCESSQLRAMKPVRFPMKAAENLIHHMPNVKIIHNMRDPRAVVISRRDTSRSFQAAYAGALSTNRIKNKTGHDIVKEAELVCRNIYTDVMLYDSLASDRPSQLMQVIYENYATRPLETAHQVYDFLGLSLPHEVIHWLKTNTRAAGVTNKLQTTRNSKVAASHWQTVISTRERSMINKICAQLLNITNVWLPT